MTKIMLVEDDKSLREIYSIRLVAEGYEVVSAGDGEEALAYTQHQFELFKRVIDTVESQWGSKFRLRHCAGFGLLTPAFDRDSEIFFHFDPLTK